MKTGLSPLAAFVILLPVSASALDSNGNSQSDVWEMVFGASGLPAGGDADGDGWSNSLESAAGTNPFSGVSRPKMEIVSGAGGQLTLAWEGMAGKRYAIRSSTNLQTWSAFEQNIPGTGVPLQRTLGVVSGRAFFKVEPSDIDSDADGVSDWEELVIGFDPSSNRTGRYSQTDSQRIVSGLTAANVISVACYDDACAEGWPDPAVLVLRRSGGLRPLAVNFSLGGTATAGSDYTPSVTGGVANFAAGQRELFVKIHPLADAQTGESTETVVLTALAGTGYSVSVANSATVSISEPAPSHPSAKEAARFLIQAGFGPDQDSAADPDQIPENVEEVMAMGIEAWIDDQLTRPIGRLTPMMEWQAELEENDPDPRLWNNTKMNAWWGRAMGLPKLRPDASTEQLPDPLRQRVAFALSQIFVISDRMERLAVEPAAMAHYYDKLLEGSFGNYQTLLKDVSMHPCMGHYLSHFANKKSDPVNRTFPDENYAREVMQLFSIGLWMLNPDGSHILDAQGQSIPTYSNANITEFARVFTGLSFGAMANSSPLQFGAWDGDFRVPMKGWDEHHDLGPKTLLLGATTPARTASAGNTGTATMADVDAAIANLSNHPNVGPFIGRLLIQRLVTSNPSPAYIGRVAAAFNATPRGDMGRTVKAILMDPEARDPAKMSDPTFGKLREPFLRTVNVARAFNASTQAGWFYLSNLDENHVQEPLNSPSVFNFYLPTYMPPGPLASAGLVAPELQIVNAASCVTAPNFFWNQMVDAEYGLGASKPERSAVLNLDQEWLMNVPASAINQDQPNVQPLDPDPLLRRLDLVLTGGTLEPESFQIIREAMARVGPADGGWQWHHGRLKLALYLIICSPEFSVQH
ncbi:DUF1800 family protein [Luteolibacter sp. GHJ8]|uniref:DUF1800 family protein n=1 Tax=Luteolibacter rhizosphaerae TaxID=2989719 RepID=A0ABT3G0F7_9BACT|nr:DUF1800 family protein [Luteolibacter rhizosphaerae]MCW1912710.1 DUF1800 family protein [Luteolibacter rhizosphaerae]